MIRHPGVLAIPKAASIEHVVQNAAALDVVLSGEELAQLDRLYPPPQRKNPAGYGLTHRSRQENKSPVTNGAFAISVFSR